ncbi:MAG: 3-methyladenine DNA glycosylase [Gammaproteobacteria bacterium]|nr:MAG: 3-methyladenine DNA glycosylase [Gammaproteobacteria bacterium]
MEKFLTIYERALERKNGEQNLQSLMPSQVSNSQLINFSNAEYLAAMTKKIFQSGFVWRVVENKWDGFEQVFWGFDPDKLVYASDEQIERMAQDKRIIRNYIKVKAVRENAYFIQDVAKSHDNFGSFIAQWPSSDITQLWLYLKKNGCRLGGNTGPYFLRAMGKDTFLLTRDIVSYLINHGLVDRQPNSLRDLKLVQSTFNDWQQESGRSMAELSKIIACSVGENHPGLGKNNAT